MPRSRGLTLMLVAAVFMLPRPVGAHVGTHGDAGLLSNLIAVALVTLSIVAYLLVDGRKRRETMKHHTKKDGTA